MLITAIEGLALAAAMVAATWGAGRFMCGASDEERCRSLGTVNLEHLARAAIDKGMRGHE